MAIMTSSTQTLAKTSLSKVSSKAKLEKQNDSQMQPSNKRRRYQRRGSKVSSMLMAGSTLRDFKSTNISLLTIEQRLQAENEYLSDIYGSQS
mmetsp:Transcript_8407/g.12192  ORF Transcript_8407/g.12192 Transcript_8407/m.12192 type:complete len:92 (+) Transcript_8407:154-429(+)